MALNMQDNGKMINKTVKELNSGLMDNIIKDNIKMEQNQGKEF